MLGRIGFSKVQKMIRMFSKPDIVPKFKKTNHNYQHFPSPNGVNIHTPEGLLKVRMRIYFQKEACGKKITAGIGKMEFSMSPNSTNYEKTNNAFSPTQDYSRRMFARITNSEVIDLINFKRESPQILIPNAIMSTPESSLSIYWTSDEKIEFCGKVYSNSKLIKKLIQTLAPIDFLQIQEMAKFYYPYMNGWSAPKANIPASKASEH